MKLAANIPVFLLCCALAGCSLPRLTMTPATEEILPEVATAIAENSNRGVPETTGLTRQLESPYLGSRVPIRSRETPAPLPQIVHTNIDLTYVEPTAISAIGQEIARETGLQVVVSEELLTKEIPDLSWSGPARGALDHLAARLGIHWRWRKQRIELYQTELRFWTIYAPIVDSKWTATVGLSGSVQSGTGGGSNLQANDNVSVSMTTASFWDQLETTIQGLLSSSGKATLNRQSGELTVVDTPNVLQRIDEWVERKNQELTSQVVVKIDLYEVERDDSSSSGLNLTRLLTNLGGRGIYEIRTDTDNTGSYFTFNYNRSPDNPDETRSIEALIRNSAGDDRVSKLTSSVIRGLNGQPVPVFFGDEISYLERRDIVQEDSQSSVRLIPGKLQDGIALNMVPRILPESNQLMLNITIRTTRVKEIKRFPADALPSDPVIQLPDLESRSLLLPVLLQSGETLVVAGLDTARSAARKSTGILSKSDNSQVKRSSMILLITPFIIRPPIEIAGRVEWR